jgi:hypothetical protein
VYCQACFCFVFLFGEEFATKPIMLGILGQKNNPLIFYFILHSTLLDPQTLQNPVGLLMDNNILVWWTDK